MDIASQNNTNHIKGEINPLIYQIEHDPGERFPLRVNSSEYVHVFAEILNAVARHRADLVALPELLHPRDLSEMICCRNSTVGSQLPCYCSPPPPAAQPVE